MSEVIYKVCVNRPCRLFIDDEEVAILEELKLAEFNLQGGKHLRKVVAIDNNAIYDEAVIALSGDSKLENITLDTTGLVESKFSALPNEAFQVGELIYEASADGKGVAVAKYVDKNLTTIIIPEQISYAGYVYDVVEIGEFGFVDCSSLVSVTIPSSVRDIRWCAFRGCSALISITIPNSVTSIGGCAFDGCSALASITIPNSVTSIGKRAFAGCSSLTSITIPNSVASIGERAFAGCSSLESIVVDSGNTAYDSRNNLHAIIESASSTLVIGCQNTTIPNTVTSIGDDAFLNCPSLTFITIPNSVTSIGVSAFEGCSALDSITFQGTIAQWEKIEFGEDWNFKISTNVVHCADGDVEI